MINQFLFLRYSRAADTDDKYTAHCLNATRCYIVLLVVLVVYLSTVFAKDISWYNIEQ